MNQWYKRYRLCIKFASLFDSEYAYDITHDAWVYYQDKTNTDLFTIPLKDESSYLFTVIKKAFFRWYYKERKGPKYIYSPVEEVTVVDPSDAVSSKLTVEMIRKELVGKAHKPQVAGEVFDALRAAEGDQNLAAKSLGLSKQHVAFYMKHLRNLFQ